jgi:hypothetical protein
VTNRYPPLRSDSIRIIIDEDSSDRRLTLDYRAREVPKLLADLFVGRRAAVTRGPDGGVIARDLFARALLSDQPHYAGLAALWIVLHGSDLPPAFGPSLDDVLETTGKGSVTIRVSPDRCHWDYQIESPAGGVGGYVSLPAVPATLPPGAVLH